MLEWFWRSFYDKFLKTSNRWYNHFTGKIKWNCHKRVKLEQKQRDLGLKGFFFLRLKTDRKRTELPSTYDLYLLLKGCNVHLPNIIQTFDKLSSKVRSYSGTPPYSNPVCTTTSLLSTTTFFRTKRKNSESIYYFEDSVNTTTSSVLPEYNSTVVVVTGFRALRYESVGDSCLQL